MHMKHVKHVLSLHGGQDMMNGIDITDITDVFHVLEGLAVMEGSAIINPLQGNTEVQTVCLR
jgi:hypothetical protein